MSILQELAPFNMRKHRTVTFLSTTQNVKKKPVMVSGEQTVFSPYILWALYRAHVGEWVVSKVQKSMTAIKCNDAVEKYTCTNWGTTHWYNVPACFFVESFYNTANVRFKSNVYQKRSFHFLVFSKGRSLCFQSSSNTFCNDKNKLFDEMIIFQWNSSFTSQAQWYFMSMDFFLFLQINLKYTNLLAK